jgi:hypothetical protein
MLVLVGEGLFVGNRGMIKGPMMKWVCMFSVGHGVTVFRYGC